MDGTRWEILQQIFVEAVTLPSDQRHDFVVRACGADLALRDRLLAMLHADAKQAVTLDRPSEVIASVLPAREGWRLDSAQFAPYRLIRPIGEGGMGVVFLAERSDLGLQVAIKILRDAWLSPSRRRRFSDEQRTLAGLQHPGIARLYDAHALDDGTPWFVMEYVEGEPLTDYAQARGLGLFERVALFQSVCDAVAYAHAHGVIHRDLKPSNILVKGDGSVRLLDFGIAKQLDADHTAGDDRTTMAFMTPAYAAPEQHRGEFAGAATDVYALGVVLFELLAGELPFPGRTRMEVPADDVPPRPSAIARRRGEAPRLSDIASAAWADLDTICAKCMSFDPAQRYQSVEALARDLGHFLRHEPLEARPRTLGVRARKFLRRRWRLTALAVLLVMAGTIAGVLMSSPGAAQAGTLPVVAVLPFVAPPQDSMLDALRLDVPREVALNLAHRTGIAVRAFSETQGLDPTRTLSELADATSADRLVSGELVRGRSAPIVRLQVFDRRTGTVTWRDSIVVAGSSRIGLQQQISFLVHTGLAQFFGAELGAQKFSPEPRNEEAYRLYLLAARVTAAGESNADAIAKLERSTQLDSMYAPAWFQLGVAYYVEARYHSGDLSLLDKARAASVRSYQLNPEYAEAGISTGVFEIEAGRAAAALRGVQRVTRRRPDVAELHFVASYALRYGGLLAESARECMVALSLTRWRLRSCAVPFILQGDYEGAEGFLTLDRELDFHRALRIHYLVRAGREQEALAIQPPKIPQWKNYDLLLACVARRPQHVIDSLAKAVTPHDDPESNYFAASHAAYCKRDTLALDLLRRAIDGGYCSYPVLETDPYFVRLRARAEFDRLRAAGRDCQRRFLAETES